ncbi:MAG: hypothetical protein ABF636_02125 [Acetobacter sp.]
MIDATSCITEAGVLFACFLWACSLAFVRNKFACPLKSGAKVQIFLLRLLAFFALGYAVQTSLVWPAVPSIALCIMLVSLNSIVLALAISLIPPQKK